MDKNNVICNSCESEFFVEEIYTEAERISFCPYCGEYIEEQDDE
tara:strand:+ start:3055 stop:3186 length:132 start_codon:yes stop_codon:yes gene_type:complete